MEAVINASPLIFLSKLDVLYCLRSYEAVYTTDIVIEEVKRGLEKGYQDSLMVLRMVEDGSLVIKGDAKKTEMYGLHPGEISVIELARDMKIDTIIVDDGRAIKTAKYFGLTVVSTPFLLLKNMKAGVMDRDIFLNKMNMLLEYGYYISPNLYMKIIKAADKSSDSDS